MFEAESLEQQLKIDLAGPANEHFTHVTIMSDSQRLLAISSKGRILCYELLSGKLINQNVGAFGGGVEGAITSSSNGRCGYLLLPAVACSRWLAVAGTL